MSSVANSTPYFNPFTTYIRPRRYEEIKDFEQGDAPTARGSFQQSVVYMNRLFGDRGNPGRMGFTGMGKEIRVQEPTQQNTKKAETKPQLTEDYTGPAAGPSPKPSASSGSAAKAAKQKGLLSVVPSLNLRKKIGAFSSTRGLWIPHRPANVSLEEWRLRYGAKNRPDND